MTTLNVINIEGNTVGQIELSDAVFNAPIREHLLWEVVVAQRAARRSGTASSKRRREVRGSSAKLYRQKGTGRARHGSSRASTFVGGGKAHGPKPRQYDKRTPKKVRRGALISALSLRNQQAQLIVLDKIELGEIKTKQVVGLLERLGVKRGLIVETRDNVELSKSVRNLQHAKFLPPEGLNVEDLLRYDNLLVTSEVVKQLEERLSR
jgi:large subunit ribosomal protein L4